MTTTPDRTYHGMPSQLWAPPAPQLIRNARMLIVGYEADRAALEAVLPPGLTANPSNLVQMNMYEVDSAQTSGFGGFSLTYLTVELEGRDSVAADGALRIPGRYFAYYWNSSPRMISYVREVAGIPALPGSRRSTIESGTLTSTLTVDGRDVITARAAVTETPAGTLGGHLNYYAHRQFPDLAGGTAVLSELVELPLPFVVDLIDATVQDITFDFPDDHPAAALAPTSPLRTPSVLYGDVTFTYSTGRRVRDYLATTD
ncbi:acetoacetate decarboxylase family protein [Pseudonocardia hispaniensis]|uniref:Acetoacetate decarboxylase family protein n=1 Tax=Pseudonocardia hispaniensis TaxID=904933 RepID=A0ABW1J2I9_9PSEU